ncbi:MAG: Ig-like domain-containing protein, partial [Solirubrobacterales bacterium]|nr:Ig-like domain-containing protein [Solirubrobacterales bacterium]
MLLRRLSLGAAAAAAALALAGPAAPAHASGVTTHAFMAEAAIPFVTDPGLRALLEAHPDEVITGGHFPDGGYAAGGYGEVTHWERFVNAYTKHLRERTGCAPITAPDGPCAQQIAFLMGIAAHGIGDERWDWLFEPKLADLGESPVHPAYATYSAAGLPGAAELMGLPPGSLINTPEFALDNIALVEFDRFKDVPRYQPPTADLVEVYKDLGREDVTAGGISRGHGAILAAAAGERAGVGTEYPRVKLTAPRVSALYYTGTGGVLDVANAAAGYYEAIWKKLQTINHPAPVVTAVNPRPDEEGIPFVWHPVKATPGPNGGGSENRIMASISESLDVDTISAEDFRLYGPDGAQLPQEEDFPRPGPYGAGDGTHTLMLWPRDDLKPCTRYTAELRPGVKDYAGVGLTGPYAWSFTTRSADGNACPKPVPSGQGGSATNGPGSGGTTTLSGPATDPAVTASPQQIGPPAGERQGLGLPATSVIAIRSLKRTRGKGSKLRVLVSCLGPDGCTGTLRLHVTRGSRRQAKLGVRRYAIAPLKSRSYTFTL